MLLLLLLLSKLFNTTFITLISLQHFALLHISKKKNNNHRTFTVVEEMKTAYNANAHTVKKASEL